MNDHSQEYAMPDGTSKFEVSEGRGGEPSERQTRILEAFEQCMIRSGFHRTTMQDVAREAGMSAGNLYRYFASKEALVSGLAALDRTRYSAMFDPMGEVDVIGQLGRRAHVVMVEMPPQGCVKLMEIWAESTRNAEVAAVCRAKMGDIQGHIRTMLQAAVSAGEIAPGTDLRRMGLLLMAIVDGLSIRRVIDPEYDGEEGFGLLSRVLSAIASGAIDLSGAGASPVAGPSPAESSLSDQQV